MGWLVPAHHLAMLAYAYLAVIRYYARTQGCLEERGAVQQGPEPDSVNSPRSAPAAYPPYMDSKPLCRFRAVLVPLETKTSGQSATKPLPTSIIATDNSSAAVVLEPVYNLFRISVAKARTTICRLVLSFRSQFFQSRRHFSSQAKDRSTTHLFGSTTKVCSSLRFTTSTAAPNRLHTPAAKGFPV